MGVLYVYGFKSVGSYKHKLSRIESLVILNWGINCTPMFICDLAQNIMQNKPHMTQAKMDQGRVGTGQLVPKSTRTLVNSYPFLVNSYLS